MLKLSTPQDRLRAALLCLRLGIGIFFVLWSIDKLVAPESTVKIFGHFYKTSISTSIAYAVGGCELLLSLAFLAGLYKRWTYGALLALHTVSTLSTMPQLLSPFGKNHLFIAAVPVLAACWALYILRDEDRLCSL
jgi:putative oxidoreductase